MKRVLLKVLFLVFSVLFLFSCVKQDPKIEPNTGPNEQVAKDFVKKEIDASTGGIVETKNNIKLIVPPGALPENVEVSVGFFGDEPQSFPNKSMVLHGTPFSIDIPVDQLNKSLSLKIPKPAEYSSEGGFIVFGFDGTHYLPYSYEEEGDYLNVEIDSVLRNGIEETRSLKKSNDFIPFQGRFAVAVMAPAPAKTDRGLLQVGWSSDGVPFEGLYELGVEKIGSDEKILVLVHGLYSSPEKCWTEFLKEFYAQTDHQYDRYFVFGYNTSHSIERNGDKFAQLIKSKFSDVKKNIDIVAHSMGGLVSRYAIENKGCDEYINKLVTLGTPHLGSEPVAMRNYLAYLIAGPLGPIYLSNGQKGLGDLDPKSDFIKNLSKNDASSVPYFAIAAINDPGKYPLSLEPSLPGDDDCVVTVKSATGINLANSKSRTKVFRLGVVDAHSDMTDDNAIIDAVIEYLKEETSSLNRGLVAYYPFNSNAYDMSGNGNHGQVHGAELAHGHNGDINSAYRFRGHKTKDYISVPNSTSLQFDKHLSISVWFRSESFIGSNGWYDFVEGGTQSLIAKDGDRRGFDLLFNHNDKEFNIHMRNIPYSSSKFSMSYGEKRGLPRLWNHIVCTIDNNIGKMYLNGSLVKSSEVFVDFSSANRSDLIFGRYGHNGGVDPFFWFPFDGVLDDIRIYNRALTDNEVLALSRE